MLLLLLLLLLLLFLVLFLVAVVVVGRIHPERVRPPTLSVRAGRSGRRSTAGDAAAASAFVTAALQQLEEDAEDEVRSFANAQQNRTVFHLHPAPSEGGRMGLCCDRNLSRL